VAIQIDIGSPLRRPSELHALVMAVIAAGSADEGPWIEWKSSVDATTPAGAFAIACAVLGFANRDPALAKRFVGGLAYLVIGAVPGKVDGVKETDLAVLENALRPYLGNAGPVWGATYVAVEDRPVLVITVEPPADGDPIHLLRKTYRGDAGRGGDEGAVFVRAQASTQPAAAAQMDMLQSRLLKGGAAEPQLDLDVDWSPDEFVVVPLDLSDAALDAWIGARRQALLDRTLPAVARPDLGSLLSGLTTGLPRDHRTPQEFNDELEEHLRLCREKLVRLCVSEAANQRLNPVVLRVANPSSRNFSEVELTLRIDAAAVGYRDDELPLEWEMPPAPRPLGWVDLSNSLFADVHAGRLSALSGHPRTVRLPSVRRVHIQNHSAPAAVSVRIDVGDLRPNDAKETEPFLLVLNAAPGATLEVAWRLTSTNVDAVQDGALALRVADRITSLALVRVKVDHDTNR
jgi:hypothetical protein